MDLKWSFHCAGCEDPQVTTVILSERNVRSLMAKLEGHPPNSALELRKNLDAGGVLVVKVERDDEHYGSRGYGPGEMHPDTEAALAQPQTVKKVVGRRVVEVPVPLKKVKHPDDCEVCRGRERRL